MRTLKTADLHLTTDPLDEYRWEFFNWLRCKVQELKVNRVDILGDLTNKKDKHPSLLVNRLVRELTSLADLCSDGVIILSGNHDYIEEGEPFFHFLTEIPKLKFVDRFFIQGEEIFLPSTRNPVQEWAGLKLPQFSYINMHQPLDGIKVGEHVLSNPLRADYFKGCKRVLSGDIHKALKVSNVEYVGAPYHIDFGSDYFGRVILRKDGKGSSPLKDCVEESISVPSIRKLKLEFSSPFDLESIKNAGINPKDQVKIVVKLHESELYQWRDLKKTIKSIIVSKGAIVCAFIFEKIKDVKVMRRTRGRDKSSLTVPEGIFNEFSRQEKLSKEVAEIGLGILKESTNL